MEGETNIGNFFFPIEYYKNEQMTISTSESQNQNNSTKYCYSGVYSEYSNTIMIPKVCGTSPLGEVQRSRERMRKKVGSRRVAVAQLNHNICHTPTHARARTHPLCLECILPSLYSVFNNQLRKILRYSFDIAPRKSNQSLTIHRGLSIFLR